MSSTAEQKFFAGVIKQSVLRQMDYYSCLAEHKVITKAFTTGKQEGSEGDMWASKKRWRGSHETQSRKCKNLEKANETSRRSQCH